MILVMASRNYKVYADVGINQNLLARNLSVLDSGAGPNCIRKSELPPGFDAHIRHGPLPNIGDANNNPLYTIGTLALVVRLGRRIVKVEFIVCERLAAPVILGCDFCDRFVEAIRPRKKLVEMDDGTEVPIVRRPLRRTPKSPPLPPSQEYHFTGGRSSTKVKTAETFKLPPSSQTWVTVTSTHHGLILLQPQEFLYENHQILASNGVADVEPGRPFRVLVAHFSEHDRILRKNQVVATALPHRTAVMPTPVSVAEVLGIMNPEGAKDLEPKTDTDLPKDSLSKFEVEDLDLSHVDLRYRNRLNKLLRK